MDVSGGVLAVELVYMWMLSSLLVMAAVRLRAEGDGGHGTGADPPSPDESAKQGRS